MAASIPSPDASINAPLSSSQLISRRLRETNWKHRAAFEHSIVEPYCCEYHNAPSSQWLRVAKENIESVMKANEALQEQLTQQDKLLHSLQNEYDVVVHDAEHLQLKMHDDKEHQAIAEKQYRELCDSRVAEERALHEQSVVLHDKVLALMQKQRNLELAKREDEKRARTNKEVLEELRFMEAKLQLQKAELDNDNEEINGGGGDKTAGSEHGDAPSNKEDTELERRSDKASDRMLEKRSSISSETGLASRSSTPYDARAMSSRPMTPLFSDDAGTRRASPVPARSSTPQRLSPTGGGARMSPTFCDSPMQEPCKSCGNLVLLDAPICRKCGAKRDVRAAGARLSF